MSANRTTIPDVTAHSRERGLEKTWHHGTVRPRPRVAIVDLDTGFSGITRYVTSLLQGMRGNEFEPILICRPEAPYPSFPGVASM